MKSDGERDGTGQKISSIYQRIATEHMGGLIKGAPLFVGFFIYFIYFCQTSFFPSVDLFSITSLLVSAFLIGATLIVVVSLGLFFPGWSWTDGCIKKEYSIGAYTLGAAKGDVVKTSRFMLCWFALPLLLNGVLSAFSWKTHDENWSVTAIIIFVPLAVSFVFGVGLKILSGGAWVQLSSYMVVTWLSLLLTNIACFCISITFLSSFENWNGRVSLEAAAVGWSLGSLIVLANAAASKRSLPTGLAVSICLAIIALIAMRGTVVLPSRMMAVLGVGHYQSQKILLKSETCDALKGSVFLVEGCAIPRPWIVWGVGDVVKLRVAKAISKDGIGPRPCSASSESCQELIMAKDSIIAVIK